MWSAGAYSGEASVQLDDALPERTVWLVPRYDVDPVEQNPKLWLSIEVRGLSLPIAGVGRAELLLPVSAAVRPLLQRLSCFTLSI